MISWHVPRLAPGKCCGRIDAISCMNCFRETCTAIFTGRSLADYVRLAWPALKSMSGYRNYSHATKNVKGRLGGRQMTGAARPWPGRQARC